MAVVALQALLAVRVGIRRGGLPVEELLTNSVCSLQVHCMSMGEPFTLNHVLLCKDLKMQVYASICKASVTFVIL